MVLIEIIKAKFSKKAPRIGKGFFVALILFHSIFAWSDSNLESSVQKIDQPITIKMEVFETPEDFQRSELSRSIPRSEENVVSFVNIEHAPQIKKKWGRSILDKIDFRYLEYPVQQLKKHFSEQVDYYRAEKTAMIVLAVLVGSTSTNYIFFADTMALSTKSFLIVTNAVLYAYLIVNIPRWQKLLKSSEDFVEKIKNRKHQTESVSEFSQIFGNLGANFTFFMIYNFAAQGIINWDDLSQLFGQDLITLMLKNTVLGTASTGVWDATFRNWYKKGDIDERKLDVFNWREAVVAGLLQSLVAAGHSTGEIGLITSAVLGTGTLMFYSDKAKSIRDRLSWSYSRGKYFFRNLASRADSAGTGLNMCSSFLR